MVICRYNRIFLAVTKQKQIWKNFSGFTNRALFRYLEKYNKIAKVMKPIGILAVMGLMRMFITFNAAL